MTLGLCGRGGTVKSSTTHPRSPDEHHVCRISASTLWEMSSQDEHVAVRHVENVLSLFHQCGLRR